MAHLSKDNEISHSEERGVDYEEQEHLRTFTDYHVLITIWLNAVIYKDGI